VEGSDPGDLHIEGEWTAITDIIGEYYDSFSDGMIATIIDGLCQLSDDGSCRVKVGSGFSGTELFLRFLRWHSRVVLQRFQIRVVVHHSFSRDIDPDVRGLLQLEFPDMDLLFRDVAELRNTRAYDCISNATQIVPHVDLFSGGFVCKKKSNINNSTRGAANNNESRSCVRNTEGSTGETWAYTDDYIGTCLPKIIVLENLKELKVKDSCEQSDVDYITARLGKHGYVSTGTVINPAECGSRDEKIRLYVVGFRGQWRIP
jgi:hypothetical protein